MSEFTPDPQRPNLYDSSKDIANELEGRALDPAAAHAALEASTELNANRVAEAVQAGKRAFIAPAHKEHNFLIVGGKETLVIAGTNIPVTPGQAVQHATEVGRIGDVRLRFNGGIALIDPETMEGKVQLEWALAHPDICRDAVNDPMVEIWASLKEGQLNKMDREPSIPRGMDVDKVLKGDMSGFAESGSIASRARGILAIQESEAIASR